MMFDEQSRPDTPANESVEEDVPQPEATTEPDVASDETPEQRDRQMGVGGMAAVAGSAGAGLGLGAAAGAVGSREAIERLLDDDAEDDEPETDEDSATELDVFNREAGQAPETEAPVPPDVSGAAQITGETPPTSDRSSGRGADDTAIIASETPITPEGEISAGVRRPDFSGSPFGSNEPSVPPDSPDVQETPPIPDFPDAPPVDFPGAPEPPEPPAGFAPPFADFGPGPSAEPPLPDFPSPPDFPTPPDFGSPPPPPSPDLPPPPATAAEPTAPPNPAEAPQPELPVTDPPVSGDPPPEADIPAGLAPTFPASLPVSEAPPSTAEPANPIDEPEAPPEAPPAAPGIDAPAVDEPDSPDVPATPESPDPAEPPEQAPEAPPPASPPWGQDDDAGNGQAAQPDDEPPPHEDPDYDGEPPPTGEYPPVEDEVDAVLPEETPAYFEYGGVRFDNPEAAGYDLININGNLYEYVHPETGAYISVLVNDDGTYTVWIRGDEQPGSFQMEFTVDDHGNYQGTGGAWYDEYNEQEESPLPEFPAEVDAGEYHAEWADHYEPQYDYLHPYYLYGAPDAPIENQAPNVYLFGGGQAMVVINPDGSETITWFEDGTYADGYIAYKATVTNQGGVWQTDTVAEPLYPVNEFAPVTIDGIEYLDPAVSYWWATNVEQTIDEHYFIQTWTLDDGMVITRRAWRDGSDKVVCQFGDHLIITYDPAGDPPQTTELLDGFPGNADEQDQQTDEPVEDNAQNEDPVQNLVPDEEGDNAAPEEPEEPDPEEEEAIPPPEEQDPDLLPGWLPASFTYDGVTWPSPVAGDFVHQITHDGGHYFASGQYTVLVHDNGDGSVTVLIDDRDTGTGWDMGFTAYSDGSYIPLEAYIPAEEPLDFQTQSAESSEEESAGSDGEQADEPAGSEPTDQENREIVTTDSTTTNAGEDALPAEDRSLDEDETTFEDEEMDDDV